MRSGNGRHRRPRQAPAFFVTAGVTGAGLALPLLGATGAQAADGATWDRVAECESGGLWSANSGNGYYGGLQLTLETWEEYGGTELADRPDLASRGQQIEVAEKILEERGPEAWPSCSTSAGLLPDAPGLPSEEPTPSEDPTWEPGPDIPSPDDSVPDTPTLPDAPEAPDAPDSPTLPDTPTPSPTTPGSEEPSEPSPDQPTPDQPSPDQPSTDVPSTEAPDRTGGGADDAHGTGGGVGSGDDTATPTPDNGDGAGRHRGGPDEREQDRADRPSRGKHAADDYRVRPGDSLSAIAAEHDVEGGWPALYENNREIVGDDPDLILPGQRLSL